MDAMPVDARSLPCEWPSSGHGRWRGVLARLGLLGLSVSLALAMLEIGLRLAGAQPKTVTVLSSYFQPSATIGWIGAPNAQSQFVSTDFDVFVSHDADGLRRCGLSTRIADDRQQSGEVVWCLGDSGTWGWGVDDGQTYVDHLNELAGGRAVYRNLGVCGSSSVQQRLLLEERLQAGPPPDRVVVLFCSNDLWENVDRDHQDPPRPYFEVHDGEVVLKNYPVPAAGGWKLRTWLKKNSLAYNYLHFYSSLARKRLKNYRRAEEPARVDAEKPASPEIDAAPAVDPEQLVALREAYRQIKQLCDERGIWFAVATEREWQKDVLEPICRELSVPILDLTQHWNDHLAAGGERTDFRSDPHYNETGHRLLAEALYERLGQAKVARGIKKESTAN